MSHAWGEQRPSVHGLTGLRQGSALGGDHLHEFVPGFDERFGPFVLELGGQGVDVDAGPGELRQHFLAVATVGRQQRAEFAVLGEGFQGALGHGVHRERRRQGLDVQDVGGLGVLGARAGPQQALRAGPGVVHALPARRAQQGAAGLVRPLRHGDAELVAQRLRHLAHDRGVPAADEHRGDGADLGLEPGLDAPLDAAQECLGRRQVVLAGEQQGDVDRHAGKDRLLDGRQAFRGARDLDEQIRSPRPGEQLFGRGEGAGRVVGQQGRHFQRHPAVHAIRPVIDGSKQVGSAGEVLQRQLEEQFLSRLALLELLADRGVVGRAVLDGLVEDGRIRGQPRHRQLVDVALERAVVQQVARDVVEPEALAQVVEQLRRFHRGISLVERIKGSLTRRSPLVGLYGEPGLCCRMVHMGHDPHSPSRPGLREDSPRYPPAGRGLGRFQHSTPRPYWLQCKRHRNPINRPPLGVLHPHDHLGDLRNRQLFTHDLATPTQCLDVPCRQDSLSWRQARTSDCSRWPSLAQPWERRAPARPRSHAGAWRSQEQPCGYVASVRPLPLIDLGLVDAVLVGVAAGSRSACCAASPWRGRRPPAGRGTRSITSIARLKRSIWFWIARSSGVLMLPFSL